MIAQSGPGTIEPALWGDCEVAAQQARRMGRAVIVSRTIRIATPVDPPAWFARAGQHFDHRFYWERPADGMVHCGAGAAQVIRCAGSAPFRDATAALRDDDVVMNIDDLTRSLGGPLYVGGFAFDPCRPAAPEWAAYPAGQLILPRFLLMLRGGEATLTISVLVAPASDWAAEVRGTLREMNALSAPASPDPAPDGMAQTLSVTETPDAADWYAAVARTAAEIRAGRFAKVVLARRVQLRLRAPGDPAAALRRLRANYPSSFVFAIATPGRCFLGATPELLVQLNGRQVETACLAGSIARGTTAAADEQLARALLSSEKDRLEHDVVVRAIQDALATVCDDVCAEAAPRLLKVRNVQHLFTPVRGRLAHDRGILDLVARLHPTPAVGGFPRESALAVIREREGFDRGWYAGPVGWIDRAGNGEFAVALRSALLVPGAALLYAGCGIVADSDPEAEYAESNLKLQPMRMALGVCA